MPRATRSQDPSRGPKTSSRKPVVTRRRTTRSSAAMSRVWPQRGRRRVSHALHDGGHHRAVRRLRRAGSVTDGVASDSAGWPGGCAHADGVVVRLGREPDRARDGSRARHVGVWPRPRLGAAGTEGARSRARGAARGGRVRARAGPTDLDVLAGVHRADPRRAAGQGRVASLVAVDHRARLGGDRGRVRRRTTALDPSRRRARPERSDRLRTASVERRARPRDRGQGRQVLPRDARQPGLARYHAAGTHVLAPHRRTGSARAACSRGWHSSVRGHDAGGDGDHGRGADLARGVAVRHVRPLLAGPVHAARSPWASRCSRFSRCRRTPADGCSCAGGSFPRSAACSSRRTCSRSTRPSGAGPSARTVPSSTGSIPTGRRSFRSSCSSWRTARCSSCSWSGCSAVVRPRW